MASIRSSDYAAIGGGSNGIDGGSQLSRQLARGPPPGGKEEEDNNSTPVAFGVNAGNGGNVEVNSECKGNGNSDGPIDNNDSNNYNVDDDNDNNNNDRGGGRTEAQTWDDCGGAGGDGGRGGKGEEGCVCDVLEQEEYQYE